jgi:hypothetical protein
MIGGAGGIDGVMMPPFRRAFDAARDPNAAARALFLRGDHLADASIATAKIAAEVWTTYTPTITAGSGAFTTVSATGRFLTLGKTRLLRIVISITTNGTAATSILATLPAGNPLDFNWILSGREQTSTGHSLIGSIVSNTQMQITKYDATYPGADGRTLVVNGAYELG